WPFTSTSKVPDNASRQDRAKCWESRDLYFACLDAENVTVPGKEGDKCSSAKKGYEQNCAKSWVDYFNKRRILAEQQKPLLEQA
ncbi:cytochrome c oxidase, subunit VIb, partial [Vararia minispora EC-137]